MRESNGNEEDENKMSEGRTSARNSFSGSGGDDYGSVSIDIGDDHTNTNTNIHIGPSNNVSQSNDVSKFKRVQLWREGLNEEDWTDRIAPEIWIENLISSALGLLGDGFLNWLNSHLTDMRARGIASGYLAIWLVALLYSFAVYILPNLIAFSSAFASYQYIIMPLTFVFAIVAILPAYTIRNYQNLYAKYSCEECGPFRYQRKARRAPGENISFVDHICKESNDHGYTIEDF